MIERDIWAAAHQMIKLYGLEAVFQAAVRADKLLDQGDDAGYNSWRLILAAIKELQKDEPDGLTKH